MLARPLCLGLLILSAISTLGCERLPDELVYIVGALSDERGQPLANVEVELQRRNAYCGPDVFGGEPQPFEPFTTTRTDLNGEYVFELLYGQVQGQSPEGYVFGACFHVVNRSETGAELKVELEMGEWDAVLARVQRWDSPPAVSLQGSLLTFSNPNLPTERFPFPDSAPRGSVNGPQPNIAWQIWSGPPPSVDSVVPRPLWVERFLDQDSPTQRTVDARVLEDFTQLSAVVGGDASFLPSYDPDELDSPVESGPEEHSFRLAVRSPMTPVASLGMAAPSRGSRCGVPEDAVLECPITDGNMATAGSFGDDGRIDLELPSPLRPSTIVFRGLGDGAGESGWVIAVRGSEDGTIFQPLGNVIVPSFDIDEGLDISYRWASPALGYGVGSLSPPGNPVRFIRLEVVPPSDGVRDRPFLLTWLNEVSLFE